MKIHDASRFPYWHLFYILKGVKVGYFSSINQLFLRNSEFKTSAFRCCANQLWILLMMMNGFYSNRLIWGGARLCGGNNSTTSSFFVFRWLSIFWITNGCALGTSLCLTLAGSMRCANRLSCRFVNARYNLNRTTALLTRFNVDVKNPFKSLRLGHWLVFCPRFFLPFLQCLFSPIS
jgi:hypothetical protein